MSDLIRRSDALKDIIEAVKTYYVNGKTLIEDIAEDVIHSAVCNVPAVDAEPIVRCGKCRNRKDFIDDSEHCRCLLLKQTVNKNDYCSFGGR